MQQTSLTQKIGSLSKILMGTAMIGFFGIFSPNTVAKAADCFHLYTQHECESNSACQWNFAGADCMGDPRCNGLDEMTCNQTEGCFMSHPPAEMGNCIKKYW